MVYLISLIISLFTLIFTIIGAFSEPNSLILRLFSFKEISICLVVAFIFIIVGIKSDKR